MNNSMTIVKIFRWADFLHLTKRDDPVGRIVSPGAGFPIGSAYFLSGRKFSSAQSSSLD